MDAHVEKGLLAASEAGKIRQDLRDNVRPFDPTDFFANPLQQVRLPAYLSQLPKAGAPDTATIEVAPLVACLSTDILGNLANDDAQRVDRVGKHARQEHDSSQATAPIEGSVHIECRFLTWRYVTCPMGRLIA